MKHKGMGSGKGEKEKMQVIFLTRRDKGGEIFSLFLCSGTWNEQTAK